MWRIPEVYKMGRDAKKFLKVLNRWGWEICEREKNISQKFIIKFNLLKKYENNAILPNF